MMTHGGMHNGVYRLFEGMHYADFGKYYVKVLKNGPKGTEPVYKNDGTGPVRKRDERNLVCKQKGAEKHHPHPALPPQGGGR